MMVTVLSGLLVRSTSATEPITSYTDRRDTWRELSVLIAAWLFERIATKFPPEQYLLKLALKHILVDL